MFLKIALLNIVKHVKRSLVVFSAVAIAVMVMTLIGGFVKGLENSFVDSLIPTSGHVQIKDARTDAAPNPLDLKYLLPNADEIVSSIDDASIVRKEKVLTFPAILVQIVSLETKAEANNMVLMGQGIDPQTQFFKNVREGLVQGSFLPNGEGVLLSKRVAKLLELELGDSVQVLTSDRGGGPFYQELKVTGLFDSGSDQTDQSMFFVSHAKAEELVDAVGMTREIRLLLRDAQEAKPTVARLAPTLERQNLKAKSWEEIFGSLLAIVKFLEVITAVIRLFFVIVAASVITNSILMTVFERIREYGTLRAIGLKRRQLFSMVVTEGAVLGAFGAVFGLALGVAFVSYFSAVGLDIGSLTQYLGLGRRFYPAFSGADWAFTATIGILVAIGSSAYAGRVASKLSVSDSLTHV